MPAHNQETDSRTRTEHSDNNTPGCPKQLKSVALGHHRVARFLGHKNINVTYAIYGHLLPNANERVIAALDAEFERWSRGQAA
jgi:integrase